MGERIARNQKIMADLYRGNPITHQNLSEWRHTGYQDWLFHQQRLEWNGRLAEEESEVTKENRCEDGYEAMGFQFLYEIAQALKTMQKIKNPNHRWERLETLTREFCRLQNAFNWSRRVALEFDKFKLVHRSSNSIALEELSAAVPPAPQPPAPASSFYLSRKAPRRSAQSRSHRTARQHPGLRQPSAALCREFPNSRIAICELRSPISDLRSPICDLHPPNLLSSNAVPALANPCAPHTKP